MRGSSKNLVSCNPCSYKKRLKNVPLQSNHNTSNRETLLLSNIVSHEYVNNNLICTLSAFTELFSFQDILLVMLMKRYAA